MHTLMLAYISALTYLIPTITGIWRFKELDRRMRLFLLLCTWSCIEVTAEYILGVRHINNSFLINAYYFIDPVLLSVFYSYSADGKKIRRRFFIQALIYACLWVIDELFFAIPGRINNEMAEASSIFVAIMSIQILLEEMKKTDRLLIDRPIFWISTGYVVYSAGVLLIFGLSNELMKLGPLYFNAAWQINWSLIIVCNLMFTKGFFCKVRQQI